MKVYKSKTLRDILYKDRHCRIETIIDVDEKDVEKLIKIGAIQCLEVIPEVYKLESKVKINVIKNPIKVENGDIELPRKVAEKIYKEDKKIKRKYNKRSKNFGKRRF